MLCNPHLDPHAPLPPHADQRPCTWGEFNMLQVVLAVAGTQVVLTTLRELGIDAEVMDRLATDVPPILAGVLIH